MATGSVDGLVSGLNTSSLIDQMLQLEAQGQTALKRRVSSNETVQSAYQAVNTKMVSLQTAAAALAKADTWRTAKAYTSNADAVSATAATGTLPGSLRFDVTSLASAASWSTSTAVSGSTDILTGPLVINGKTVTPLDDSVLSVAAAVNARSDLGVRAAVVQMSSGQYRLQLSSTNTGAGNVAVTGIDAALGSSAVAGTDAVIYLNGTRDAADRITSSSNTFSGVVPGLTFTAKKQADGVTVDLKADADGVADKVQAMVTAANAAIDEIAKHTKYNPATKAAGALVGDYTVRQLQQQVLGTVSSVVTGGGSAKDAGIELTRDGHLTFNRETFVAAFNTDPAKAQRLVGRSGTFAPATSPTGSVTLLSAADGTVAGTYEVEVTRAATRTTGDVVLGGAIAAGDKVRVDLTGGAFAEFVATGGESVTTVVAGLNAAFAAKGLAVSASENAGAIRLQAVSYGSAGVFTSTGTGAFAAGPVTAGLDVVGTIDGVSATGSGQLLSLPTNSTSGARGLSLLVTLTPADVAGLGGPRAGDFTYSQGVAQKLASAGASASDPISGNLTSAIKGRTSTIDDLKEQIANWDVRLQLRRTTLVRQFANLEVSLGKLRDQSNWLAGQLASLPSAS
jgi:flagellar hook-associated protein 2